MSRSQQNVRAVLELLALAGGLAALAVAFAGAPAPSRPGNAERAHAEAVLADLCRQFLVEFAPLLRQPPQAGKPQLLLFDSETDFRAHARRVAPALAGSAGFYAAADNQLAILNQAGSADFARARHQIVSRQHRLRHWHAAAPEQRIQAATRLDAWRHQLDSEARASTDRLLRHEGAHQLFHAYRIESPQSVELTWLSEGLAQYCEPETLGAFYRAPAQRLICARDAGTMIPLARLLEHRDAAGFFALPAEQTELAYAQSWALVYLLMQEPNRSRFFEFIESYRRGEPPGLEVEIQWQTFINNL